MIPLLLTNLLGSKNWHIDDNPQLFRGVVEDPHALATWEEVEYCINFPEFYDIKFIDSNSLDFIPIPKYPRCWAHDCEDVKDLIQVWKDGHNLVINNFDSGNRKKQEILREFERVFECRMAMHIYAGCKGCSSFRVHEDTASNFIIQIEGQTHWTVYKNRCSNVIKPMETCQEEFNEMITQMEPAVDVMLTPGDMIYIPARCYHQAQPDGKRLSVSIPMQHMLPHLKPFDRTYYELPH